MHADRILAKYIIVNRYQVCVNTTPTKLNTQVHANKDSKYM